MARVDLMRSVRNRKKYSRTKQRALLSWALKGEFEFPGRSLRKLLRCSGQKKKGLESLGRILKVGWSTHEVRV